MVCVFGVLSGDRDPSSVFGRTQSAPPGFTEVNVVMVRSLGGCENVERMEVRLLTIYRARSRADRMGGVIADEELALWIICTCSSHFVY